MMVLPRRGKNVGGAAVVTALMSQIRRLGIESHPRILITDLLQADGRVAGAIGVDRSSAEVHAFHAGAVVLATADCSFRGSYACTEATTGDGFRLAYEAGVRLSNLEFLCTNTGSPRFGFEGTGVALRWGGKILNAGGEAFMGRYHPDADAAEIGILTQAMAREVQEGNGPPFYLDMGGHWNSRLKGVLSGIGGFMPLNLDRLEAEGIDLEEPQEWTPAVQGLRGGVRTGPDCQSDLPGLFAAGLSQALDPGLFNGWSTMRAMWSGETAGRAAARFLRQADPLRAGSDQVAVLARRAVAALDRSGGLRPGEVLDRIQRSLFPFQVTILKDAASLSSALCAIEELRDAALSGMCAEDPHELAKAHETASMLQVAEMYLRASLARTESRGDHFREDYPELDNRRWLAWVNLARGDGGQMVLETEPVPLDRYPCQPEQETRAR
jgi:succinate dehydrogenase/fumarate reductase flavoprotein subunit